MRRRWLPDTVAGWTAMVLVAGLLVSHLVALAIYSGNRLDTLSAVGGRQAADRIYAVVHLIEDTPPPGRNRILRAIDVPGLRAGWGSNPAVSEDAPEGLAASIRDTLRRRLDGAEVRVALGAPEGLPPIVVGPRFGPPRDLPRQMFGGDMHRLMHGAPFGEVARVSVRLSDGSWLNFLAPLDTSIESLWRPRFVLSFLLMTAAVAMLSVWALRRAIRPLNHFAVAAERLGRDVNALPLTEGGPREVRRAARAFNEMQRRLQRFTLDRTQMLAAISHDLRTPITRMRLRAEFVEDDEQRGKMLSDLEEMEAMIAATLSFARDDAAREARGAVDVAALLQGLCGDQAAAGASAVYQGPPSVVIEASPTALKRGLANLIDNAVKYGGGCRVRLGGSERQVVVEIEDDGPGIPDDEMERVFAPFYRLERSRSRETGGTGLGLSVARSVARAHGGDVTLANRDGGGLTATMTLPRAYPPQLPQQDERAAVSSA